jgi:hypothetical protein
MCEVVVHIWWSHTKHSGKHGIHQIDIKIVDILIVNKQRVVDGLKFFCENS